MQQVKSAKVGRWFRSQTFTAFGHQWYLKLFPSGVKQESIGETQLFLFVAALSPKVRSLRIRYKLCCRANENTKSRTEQQKPQTTFKKKIDRLFDSFRQTQKDYDVAHEGQDTLARPPNGKARTTMWPKGKVKLSDIQKLDRLTFTVDFDLIGAIDWNENAVLGQFKDNGAERINKSIHGIDVFAAAVTWRLTKKIKCARMGSSFFSPIFEAFGHKWYLKVYPNGHNEEARGSAMIFLRTTSLSSNIKTMCVCRRLTFVEGNISDTLADFLRPKKISMDSWPLDTVKTSDLTEHDQLTFRVEFDLYGVFDEHDKNILGHFKDDDEKQLNIPIAGAQHQGMAAHKRTWSIVDPSMLQRIKSAKVGEYIDGEVFTVFAHEWYLRLYPNGIDAKNEGSLLFFLMAVDLLPQLKSMLVRRYQRFVEGDAVSWNIVHIDQDKKYMSSWARDTVKYSDVLDLEQLTFIVDFEVIEAVYHDGNVLPGIWLAAGDHLIAAEDQLIAAQKEAESLRKQLEMEQKAKEEVDRDIPESFLCPITHRVMRDPVLAFDGRSYEREAIEEYLKKHNKSPVTGAEAITSMVFPNHDLHSRIIAFIEAQDMASKEQQSKEGEGETTFE